MFSGSGPGLDSPLVVLTYNNGGGRRLQASLAAHPALACTAGTGILPACEYLCAAWRRAERRPPSSPLTPPAARAVGSSVGQMISVIIIREGKPRWCETAAVGPPAAASFLAVVPKALFICLHRSFPGVAAAAFAGGRLSLAGAAYSPYSTAYPGNPLAALAAWWAGRTEGYLDFEDAHPASCLRVLYEDLPAAPGLIDAGLLEFASLEPPATPVPWLLTASGNTRVTSLSGDPAQLPELPLTGLPAPLLARVNDLHARLGRPPLA